MRGTVYFAVEATTPVATGADQSCQPFMPHRRTYLRPVIARANRTAAPVASEPVFRNVTLSIAGFRATTFSASSICWTFSNVGLPPSRRDAVLTAWVTDDWECPSTTEP